MRKPIVDSSNAARTIPWRNAISSSASTENDVFSRLGREVAGAERLLCRQIERAQAHLILMPHAPDRDNLELLDVTIVISLRESLANHGRHVDRAAIRCDGPAPAAPASAVLASVVELERPSRHHAQTVAGWAVDVHGLLEEKVHLCRPGGRERATLLGVAHAEISPPMAGYTRDVRI